MSKIAEKNKQGFTIIEVVLVLAIAALIFLMVFIALPALQRSQRNTQRRDDMSRFSSQITQFQSNNRGKIPGEAGVLSWANFITQYMRAANDTFEDPDGTAYTPRVETSPTAGRTVTLTGYTTGRPDHIIHIYRNAHCGDGEGTVTFSSGTRNLAFLYVLEGNGVYCGTN